MMNFNELNTKNFLLKKITSEYKNDIFNIFSDIDIMRYYGMNPIKDIDMTAYLIKDFDKILNEGTGIRWGIINNNNLIGTIGYFNIESYYFRGEIGYELNKSFWNKGVISEVLPIIINYGFNFLKLNRIDAKVNEENVFSIKLLEKNKFIKEANLKEYTFNYIDKRFEDMLLYRLLKKDWI